MARRHLVRTTLRSLMFAAAVGYIGFHALHGEHGIYALVVQSHRKTVLEEELTRTALERGKLEHRVSMLRSETLDRDLLDEQSRRYLGVVGPDEIVVMNDEK